MRIWALFAVSAPALAPFGYEAHGADWQEGTCASRTAQSPINLADIFGKPSGTFEVNYGEPLPAFDVVNDGEQLVARVPPGGGRGVVVRGQAFDLEEVAFHSPAEHTIGAHRPALEVQLKHTKAGSPRRVHVSVLFDAPAPVALVQQTPREIADAETEAEVKDVDALTAASALDATLREPPVNKTVYLPPLATDPGYALGLGGVLAQELPLPEAEASVQDGSWDLGALLGQGEFYGYTGSMTVPPCTENVQWLVSRVAKPASADQLERFRKALKDLGEDGNWRIVMPFNQRPVEVLTMAKRVAPVQPSPALAKEDAEREFVAKRNAQDAVTISQYMRGYARDVDQELRTATIAHLKEFLAPSPTPAPTAAPTPAPLKTWSKSFKDPEELRRALTSGAMNAVREAARRMAEDAATGLGAATNLTAFPLPPGVTLP